MPEIAPRVVVLQEVVEAVTSVEKRAILLEIAPREVQVVAEQGGHVINVEKRATVPELVGANCSQKQHFEIFDYYLILVNESQKIMIIYGYKYL